MPVIVTTPDVDALETLAGIRKKFLEFSGRYDLENADGSDNGANFFINAGQKFLDRMLDIDRFRARYTRNLEVGESLVRLLRARVVEEVWLYDADLTNKRELTKATYREYSQELPQDETLHTNGTPASYLPYILRQGNLSVSEVGVASEAMDVVANDEGIDAIRIFPPSDAAVVVEVVGLFYSPTLSEDTDRSFWSAQYPEVLIQASLLQLEKFMRNTEGVKDQLNALQLDVQQLDFDAVAQQIVDVTQMEG